MQQLDGHLVLAGPMDGAVQPEADHKDPGVHDEPDLVRGAAVAPPGLDLLESEKRFLLR